MFGALTGELSVERGRPELYSALAGEAEDYGGLWALKCANLRNATNLLND